MDEAFGCRHAALSSLIETEPMGFSGDPFLNAAVLYRLLTEERGCGCEALNWSTEGEAPERECGGEAFTRLGRRSRKRAPHSLSGAYAVLEVVKTIERAMGRTDQPEYDADGKRVYHSRIIDIDILFYGKETIDTPDLTIPHKGIADRPFVLIPLNEIARPSLRRAYPSLVL